MPPKKEAHLGGLIKLLAEQKSLSEISRRMDAPYQTLTRMRDGQTSPTLATLERLLKAVNASGTITVDLPDGRKWSCKITPEN